METDVEKGFRNEPLNQAAEGAYRSRTGEKYRNSETERHNLGLSDELGNRLAALADGEGCFYIGRKRATLTRLRIRPNARDVYYCAFAVKMRRDELPFLDRMRNELGLGVIRAGRAARDEERNNRPWCRWEIAKKSEVARLIAIVDAFPLWSKKQRDYAIWREAALYWIEAEPGTDLAPLADARRALTVAREYEADHGIPPGLVQAASRAAQREAVSAAERAEA